MAAVAGASRAGYDQRGNAARDAGTEEKLMQYEPGLESAVRRHEELTAGLDGLATRSGEHSAAVVWGGPHDYSYLMRAISSLTHGHWPPPAEEYHRVVMD